jgi:hypothetical protein
MTLPLEPPRLPLVEPAAPVRPVARRREEPQDDGSKRRREEPKERPEEDDSEGGLHVDVLA